MSAKGPSDEVSKQDSNGPFDAVSQAAEEAAQDPDVAHPKNTGPTESLSATYQREISTTLAAHRKMRWAAFGVLGVLVLLILILEMTAAGFILFNPMLMDMAWTTEAKTNWHVLFFIGTIFVLVTAVALSLAIALLKMISDRSDFDEGVKLPIAELIKTIVELFKGK